MPGGTGEDDDMMGVLCLSGKAYHFYLTFTVKVTGYIIYSHLKYRRITNIKSTAGFLGKKVKSSRQEATNLASLLTTDRPDSPA